MVKMKWRLFVCSAKRSSFHHDVPLLQYWYSSKARLFFTWTNNMINATQGNSDNAHFSQATKKQTMQLRLPEKVVIDI